MATYLGEIAAKRIHVQEQIDAVERNRTIVGTVGGSVTGTLRDESILLARRMELLNWASSATTAAVNSLSAAHTALLPAGAIDHLHGDVSGLSRDVVTRLGFLELLELVLGTHPGQAGRPLVDAVLTSDEIQALYAQVSVVAALGGADAAYEALKSGDGECPDPTI